MKWVWYITLRIIQIEKRRAKISSFHYLWWAALTTQSCHFFPLSASSPRYLEGSFHIWKKRLQEVRGRQRKDGDKKPREAAVRPKPLQNLALFRALSKAAQKVEKSSGDSVWSAILSKSNAHPCFLAKMNVCKNVQLITKYNLKLFQLRFFQERKNEYYMKMWSKHPCISEHGKRKKWGW